MRKIGLMLVLVGTLMFGAMAASATPPAGGPPGQGECEHGNSGQECRPDPQPDNGQDCEEHGPNEGGVNEDHCATTTTASSTTPTGTTSSTTSTVTETETTVVETTTTTTTIPSEVTTTSVTEGPPTTSEEPTTTTIETDDSTTSSTTANSPSSPSRPRGTAFTGPENVVPLAAVALALLLVGSSLLWLRTRRAE